MLYPTVMREMLIGAAKARAFEPLWSARILEEWRRAALKHGETAALQVESEAVFLKIAFPKASVQIAEDQQARFWLPDPSDIHVLAAAVIGGADGIVTLNNKDFPEDILAEECLTRVNPDSLLLGIWQTDPDMVTALAQEALDKANQFSDKLWTMKTLLKKARLHRLGAALAMA